MMSQTSVTIAGRVFRFGAVDVPMRIAAHQHTLVFDHLIKSGGDLWGSEARHAASAIAELFLKRHAPDVTSEWLYENMTPENSQTIAEEFRRQALDLAVRMGAAGRA
jgi:hypothetical protein